MPTAFYADLFTSPNPHNLEQVLDGVQSVVIEEMRAGSARPYTVEEVEFAIKEMAPFESSGIGCNASVVLSNLLD